MALRTRLRIGSIRLCRRCSCCCSWLRASGRARRTSTPASRSRFIVGAGVGGGYDLQARITARHLGRHIPGHPSIVVQNMPSRIAAAQPHVQHRAEGRHHDRAASARHPARQADLSVRRALRDREIPLARQPQQRDRGDARLAHRAAQDRQGPVRQGADRRRHHRRRSRDHAAALQLADRHQVQGRHRLQQHGADRARDRARRGAGHRRLVVVESQGGAAAMARATSRSRC